MRKKKISQCNKGHYIELRVHIMLNSIPKSIFCLRPRKGKNKNVHFVTSIHHCDSIPSHCNKERKK